MKLNDEIMQDDQQLLKNIHDDIIDDILYLQDIFSLKIEKINFMLANCIFYYLVLPLLCGSIVSLTKPKIAISVAIYLMLTLFYLIKDEAFNNMLFVILFYEKLTKKLLRYMDDYPKNVRNYFYDWTSQKKSNYNSFSNYITGNFSEAFVKSLIYQSTSSYPEILAIVKKYEKLSEENMGVVNGPNFFQNLLEDVLSKFSHSEIDIMMTYHKNMSISTGINVGLSTSDNKKDCVINIMNRMLEKMKVKLIIYILEF